MAWKISFEIRKVFSHFRHLTRIFSLLIFDSSNLYFLPQTGHSTILIPSISDYWLLLPWESSRPSSSAQRVSRGSTEPSTISYEISLGQVRHGLHQSVVTDRAESLGASRITISSGHGLPTKAARCGFFTSWFSGAPPYNLSYARKHAILPTGELALPLDRGGYPAVHFLCQGGPRKRAKKMLVLGWNVRKVSV